MKFKNFIQIIFTTAILMCGSCSSRDNDNLIVNKTYTDSQITEMVQKDALKYFWDYAQTNSKLARERYHTDNPGKMQCSYNRRFWFWVDDYFGRN
jgi:hypothetical protein